MDAVIESFFAGFPILIGHFALTIAILGFGTAIYIWLTPYHEIKLIKSGNTAAALSLSGAIVGLALPLAVAMAGSVNAYDILIWGALTLIIQLGAYRIADVMLRGLPARIENDEIGAAILVVGIKLAVAMINAAAVTG
jgi:putative membrane protein